MFKTVIYGGGTISHIRSHLALCAPAFGNTARQLHKLMKTPTVLELTKMADNRSDIVTAEDLWNNLSEHLLDWDVKCIVMSAAVCDFTAEIDGAQSGAHAERLNSKQGTEITCTPADKIIGKIKKLRPDVIVVGFKTTTNAEPREMQEKARKQLDEGVSNLVLANDTVTRLNMLVTRARQLNSDNRADVLRALAETVDDKVLFYHCRNVVFSGLTLRNADFSNLVARGANFTDTTLIDCDFHNTALERATFKGARLVRTKLPKGLNARGMQLDGVTYTD